MAKRPLSKKNNTPRKRKNTPKPDTPMPISAHKNKHKFVRNTSNKIKRETHQRALTLVVCYG